MGEKIPESLSVQGHSVIYDESSRIGIDHLNSLSYEEAGKIFNQAGSNGSAPFKDGNGYGYDLVCNYDGTYKIKRKY
jgi:hypothetical protein